MKQLIALTIILFFLTNANAQSGVGFKGGVSMNSRTGYPQGVNTASLYTLQGSFFLLKDMGSNIIIQPSLGYYGKGMQFKDFLFTDNLGNNLGTGRLNTRFDYLEFALPIMLRVVDNDPIIFGGIGPYLAYAFAGKYVIRGINKENLGETPQSSDVDFNYNNRFDAGFTVQVSMVVKKKIMLSINYDQGLTRVIKNSGFTSRNASYGVTAGYIFKSKSK